MATRETAEELSARIMKNLAENGIQVYPLEKAKAIIKNTLSGPTPDPERGEK